MGAGAVSGHSTSRSNQVYPTPPASTYTTEGSQQGSPQNQPSVSQSRGPVAMMSNNKVQTCETCDNVFSFFKRRKVCRDCRRVFCSSCLPKPPSSLGQNGRQCTKCTILTSGKFTRAQLQAWKVKDMRCFLDVRNIPTTTCKEKHDLIDLLIVNFCLESNSSLHLQEQEHDRLVGELADRMRQSSFYMSPSHPHQIPDDDDDTSPTSSPQMSRTLLRIRSAADQTDTSTANLPSPSQTRPRSSQSGPNLRSNNQSEPTQPRASQSGPVSTGSRQSRPTPARNTQSGPTLTSNSQSQPAVTISTQDEAEVAEDDEEFEQGMSNLRSILSGHLLERQQRELMEALNRLQEELAQDEPETRPGIQRATIDDIQCEDDVEGLTVRQMKEILVNNFVDYRGCVEKPELVDRVKRLWAETQANKQRVAAALATYAAEDTEDAQDSADTPAATTTAEAASGAPQDGEKDVCKICMDAAIDCILLECGHMITCTKCGKRLADCPICRQYITRVVHVFRS